MGGAVVLGYDLAALPNRKCAGVKGEIPSISWLVTGPRGLEFRNDSTLQHIVFNSSKVKILVPTTLVFCRFYCCLPETSKVGGSLVAVVPRASVVEAI